MKVNRLYSLSVLIHMLAITLGIISHYGYVSFNVMMSIFIASFFIWEGGRRLELTRDRGKFVIESLESIDPNFGFVPKQLAMELAENRNESINALKDQAEFQRDLINILELQHDVDKDYIRLLEKRLTERKDGNEKIMV